MSYKALAFGAALAIGVSSAATAGLNGNTVSANYDWPTLGTVLYASGTAVVGPGVEFDNIGGFGVGLSPTVDFSDSNILVTYPGGWLLSGTGSFDGWVFTDYTKSDIIGVSLAGTNLPGFTAADLSFDSSDVYANTLGLGPLFSAGTYISINVSTVPESSTWAMILLGFVGLGFAGYRTSRKAASIAA
jgi:hypothetical protein